MSMLGLTELIFLLTVSWLPGGPAGPPQTAQNLFKYVPPDATLVASIDLKSIGVGLPKTIAHLAKQPFVANVPPIKKAVARATRLLNQKLAEFKRMLSLDLMNDLNYATVALHIGRGMPEGIVTVHGKIGEKTVASTARMIGLLNGKKIGKLVVYQSGSAMVPSLIWNAKANLVFFVSPKYYKWLTESMGTTSHKNGSLAQKMVKSHSKQNLLSFGFQPNAAFRTTISRDLEGPFKVLIPALTAVYASQRFDGFDIVAWSNKSSVTPRFSLILRGFGKLLSTSSVIANGFLDLADGFLEHGDPDLPREVKALLKYKTSIRKYLVSRFLKGKAVARTKTTGNKVLLTFRGNQASTAALMGITSGAIMYFTLGISPKMSAPKRSKTKANHP